MGVLTKYLQLWDMISGWQLQSEVEDRHVFSIAPSGTYQLSLLMKGYFWGLWLFPFGLLVFRSGFLPRFIGVWLMINCFGYVALSIIALFAPDYYAEAFKWAQPVLFGELAIMLWLLIKGAKVPTAGSALEPVTAGLVVR